MNDRLTRLKEIDQPIEKKTAWHFNFHPQVYGIGFAHFGAFTFGTSSKHGLAQLFKDKFNVSEIIKYLRDMTEFG